MRKTNFMGAMLQGRRGHLLAGLLFGSGLLLGPAKTFAQSIQPHRQASAEVRMQAWRDLLVRASSMSEDEKLEAVNRFFNRQVRYVDDRQFRGQPDHWASPIETLEAGAGDCEDYALAKYFTLRLLGVPEQRLRLVYANLATSGQAHMLLGYWSDNGEYPLLLDNLREQIVPLAQRHDLEIQFAFDGDHLYRLQSQGLVDAGDAHLLPDWANLQVRVRRELREVVDAQQLMLAAAAGQTPSS